MEILNWATFDKHGYSSHVFRVILSLSLVCRRFHRILTPFLFEKIGFEIYHTSRVRLRCME